MKTEKANLQERATEIRESIEAGGEYLDEYEHGFLAFVGYRVEALRSRFEREVEDMRDYSEPDQQHWVDLFGEINSERHGILILQPSLITVDELRIWNGYDEERAYQCFCSGAVISLSSEDDGPVVVIGTMGENIEPEIFSISNSRKEAEKTWTEEWI